MIRFILQTLETTRCELVRLVKEYKHVKGYTRCPTTSDEFDGWESVRVWEQ
jgi:hypothetical protein